MSQSNEKETATTEISIDLRDRYFAALLAWLVPGAGHFYQRRYGKGVLFASCILGTFFFGFYLGDGKVVYASWGRHQEEQRIPYFAQIGAGAVALPALVQANVASRPFGDFMAPPGVVPSGGREVASSYVGDPPEHVVNANGETVVRRDPDQLAQWSRRIDGFEMGTVYTMIAGLLNILAIYDAACGPVALEERPEDDSGGKKPKSPDKPNDPS